MYDSTNLTPPEKQSYSWNQVWITALTEPSVKSYEALIEDPKASVNRAVIWLFVSLSLPFFLVMLVGAMAGTASTDSNVSGILVTLFCAPVLAAFYILNLAIRVGITHGIAKALGGEGQFGSLFYAFAAFEAPLGILASVFSSIRILNCLVLFLGLYGLVLSVIATMAVYRLNTGRAIVASFGLVVVLIGVAILLIFILALLGPQIGSVFSEIRSTLGTPAP